MKYKKFNSNAKAPYKKHDEDAGYDLSATQDEIIKPNERALIGLGIGIDIPKGNMLALCSRSSLALKKGLININGIGVIDETYKGELKLAVMNITNRVVKIEAGERIAQVIPLKVDHLGEPVEVAEIGDSQRGEGGFGSTKGYNND